jgi:hypothetical protein
VQLHKHATEQGYATQSEAEPETPNPRTGQETGLNNLNRGLGETAHRSPAGGMRRDVRARPTQGRVAPAKGNAKPKKYIFHSHSKGCDLSAKVLLVNKGEGPALLDFGPERPGPKSGQPD